MTVLLGIRAHHGNLGHPESTPMNNLCLNVVSCPFILDFNGTLEQSLSQVGDIMNAFVIFRTSCGNLDHSKSSQVNNSYPKKGGGILILLQDIVAPRGNLGHWMTLTIDDSYPKGVAS